MTREVRNQMSLGKRIHELRKEAGLSQKDLARITGISRNAVSQWEADETAPATSRLPAIARALGVRVEQLLEPSQEVRNRILEWAFKFFDRHGVEETDLDIICTAAEVERAELDALFPNKQELLYAVLKAYNERTFDQVKKTPPSYGSLDARIKYLLRIYYAHDLDHINLTAAMHAYSWQWTKARERENTAQLGEHHRVILQLMDEAAAKGEIRTGNYQHASELIFAAYTYMLRKAVFDSYNAEQLVAALSPQIDLILAGLGYGTHPPRAASAAGEP